MATKYSFLNTPPTLPVLIGARNARARAAGVGGGPAAKEVLAKIAVGTAGSNRACGAVHRPTPEVGDVGRRRVDAGSALGVGRGKGAARDVIPGVARCNRRA